MAPVEVEVAVVGAGAAGLAAAAELRAQGRSVIVLEARDRVGGRACTDSTALRAPFDLGASYIHACEQGNPWADIALALGEPVVPDRRRRVLAQDGGLAPAADEAAAYAGAANRAWPLIADAVARGWRGAVGDLLPRATVADRWVAALVGPWLCGVDTAEVDAEDFVRARDGQDWLVPGGYGRLVARFGAALPVRLGCAVTAVRATPRGVELRTDQGSLRAAHAIVTVPLGVLAAEQIRFDPPLPAGVADAVEALPMGNLIKVGVRFDGDPFGLGDTFYLHSTCIPSWRASAPSSTWPAHTAGTWRWRSRAAASRASWRRWNPKRSSRRSLGLWRRCSARACGAASPLGWSPTGAPTRSPAAATAWRDPAWPTPGRPCAGP
jgi:monoamine oxidase